jgi:AmmeMemoRadiSam system protein A
MDGPSWTAHHGGMDAGGANELPGFDQDALVPSPFAPEEEDALFALAEQALRSGLAGSGVPSVALERLGPRLSRPEAAFVTLEVAGELNGCIGTLERTEPLAAVVARCAYGAAFEDPRLPRLRAEDWSRLEIEISVLGPLDPLPVEGPSELAAVLRPFADGLFVEAGPFRATFLPAVWRRLEDPGRFVELLLAKAGLPAGLWPRSLRAFRYRVRELRRRASPLAHPPRPTGGPGPSGRGPGGSPGPPA